MAIKTSTKHPYAAIEHRVIDSAAYADLTFSARSLLVLVTRQLNKDNNGSLQATYSYMRPFGFSVNTLTRAIAELISHGLIYRTRSGGYQQGAAQYAVTWLSVSKREGLFLAGFKSCAWRDWQPADKKTPHPKVIRTHIKNGEWTAPATPKSDTGSPPKTEHNELMPCRGDVSGVAESLQSVCSDDGYQRVHDEDQQAGEWDYERGEFVLRPAIKQHTTSPAIEQTRAQIISLMARRQA